MRRISSAVKQGQRPVAALLGESDPFTGWTSMDYKLQDAYYTMDTEICTICNNPIWLCHSTDNRIDFKVTVRTCYAKAELDDFESSTEGKNIGSGEYLAAIPIGIEDEKGDAEPLPPRHEAFRKMQDS